MAHTPPYYDKTTANKIKKKIEAKSIYFYVYTYIINIFDLIRIKQSSCCFYDKKLHKIK